MLHGHTPAATGWSAGGLSKLRLLEALTDFLETETLLSKLLSIKNFQLKHLLQKSHLKRSHLLLLSVMMFPSIIFKLIAELSRAGLD
jgi:hypothetical protein